MDVALPSSLPLAVAALGMLGTILDGIGWLIPIAVTAGLVYYVVNAGKKKYLPRRRPVPQWWPGAVRM